MGFIQEKDFRKWKALLCAGAAKYPLVFALFVGIVRAQTLVTISDTLYNADGTKAGGRLIVSWDRFTAADGSTVDAGSLTYNIPTSGPTQGAVNLQLFANQGATPSGTSYRARYFLTNGTSYTETWVVPATGPVTISAIRTSTVPSPTVLFNPTTQLYSSSIAKGSLLAGSATAGYLGVLPVGADSLCLVADSTQSLGVKWGSCAAGGGGGITSLNGQTGATQTFSRTNDTNVTLTIASAANDHGFTLGWQGQLGLARGGTGADLSGTGGANQFVKQSTLGGALSVGTIADADVPDTITLTNLTQITNRAITDTTGTLPETRGGTGETTYTLGDLLYSDAANSLAKLAGNTTTTKQFLTQTGTGAASAAPVWGTIADGDIPSTLTRDSEINVQGTANEISSSGSGTSPTLSIADTFRITGKTATAPIKTGTTPPATCTVGDYFFDTDATTGQNTYACTATNTWTLQGDGGGGGGAPSGAQYVTMALDGTLSAERVLTGTSNQIVITDGGANGNATLSVANPFTFPGKATFAASTTSAASANIPAGTAPTTPSNGDVWQESNRIKARLNGVTETLAHTSELLGPGADDTIPVSNGTAFESKALANGALSYATATNTFSQASTANLSDGANVVKNNQANVFTSAGGVTMDNQLGVRLREATANGTNYVELRSSANRAADYTLELAVTGDCTANANGGALTINASNQIVCSDDDGGAGGGDNIRVEDGDNAGTFTAMSDADFDDSGDINFTRTAGPPDVITATVRADSVALGTDTTGNYIASLTSGTGLTGFPSAAEGATGTPALDYSATLAGNPTLNADECVFSTDGTGGGILCEGAADTVEGLLVWNPSTSDRTLTLPDATDTLVGRATTDTLTNKTIDAEGTGNTVTIPQKIFYRAAICQGATASLGFSTPTTNPAVAACQTGTNTQYGTADFADGANALSVQDHFTLPSDWTGNIDLSGKWSSSTASTNSVVWQVQTACVADGETADPTWNTASTVTDAGKGTANQTNDFSMTSITITGCAAGEELFFKFFRDPAHASDTFAGTARLISLTFTIRRAM